MLDSEIYASIEENKHHLPPQLVEQVEMSKKGEFSNDELVEKFLDLYMNEEFPHAVRFYAFNMARCIQS